MSQPSYRVNVRMRRGNPVGFHSARAHASPRTSHEWQKWRRGLHDLAPRLFRAGSLAAIHVHFPDPWWKRRHHHRRLVDDRMSSLLLALLRPGGLLDFRTDVERYALDAVARLEEIGFENEAGRRAFSDAPPGELPSTREKRYLESGQHVWRLRMRRPA